MLVMDLSRSNVKMTAKWDSKIGHEFTVPRFYAV